MGTALDRRDKRYQFRISANLLGRLRDTPLLTGDVSYRGVFLRTDSPPAKRQLVRVRLSLPGGFDESSPSGVELVVTGMVAHVVEPGDAEGRAPGAGIEFYGMDGEHRDCWERFIRHVAQNHPEAAEKAVTLAPPGIVDRVNRRYARHAAELRVLIEPAEGASGDLASIDTTDDMSLTQDISKGGMFIRTTLPLSVGAGLLVELTHPRLAATFAIECVVRRRVFGSLAGIGVEFLEMTDERWRALVDFVQPFGVLDTGGERTETKRPRPVTVRPLSYTLRGP